MKCWRIRLEVAMTDKETIKHIYDTLDVGWWGPRDRVGQDVNHSGVGLHRIEVQTK